MPAAVPGSLPGDRVVPRAGWRALAVLVAALILAGAALTSHGLAQLVDAQQALSRSRNVGQDLSLLMTRVLDAEIGKRGYLLTGQLAYLQPYERSLRELATSRADLARELNDVPGAAPLLAEIDRTLEAKMRSIARSVRLQAEGRGAEALQAVLDGTAKARLDELRAAIAALEAAEQRRLLGLRADHAAAVRLNYLNFGVSLGLNLLLLAVLAWRVQLAARQAREARLALAQRNDRLADALAAMATRNDQAAALSELVRQLQSCADTRQALELLESLRA